MAHGFWTMASGSYFIGEDFMDIGFYHRSDLDGHCSGAIYRKYMNENNIDCKLHGMEYGDDIPWDLIDNNHIAIMDWSFQPWDVFDEVIQRASTVVWIDHHKSAISSYFEADKTYDNIESVLNIKYAACELTWKYFFEEPIPYSVKLLGRYDMWDHVDNNVLPFQYRMRMEDTDPKNGNEGFWYNVFNDLLVDDYVDEGQLLLRYQKHVDASNVKAKSFDIEWAGKKWLTCNGGKGSTYFESIWDNTKYDGMMSFYFNGKHWTISLYSDREDMDCSEICKANGGGGHKGAAGFQCKELPFL